MTFDDFKHICFTHGIHPDIIEQCRDFVVKHNIAIQYSESSDLGYSELGDITSVSQGIKEMLDCIKMSTLDYDALGRSRQKILMRKFKQDPGKHFRRLALKTYYLLCPRQ